MGKGQRVRAARAAEKEAMKAVVAKRAKKEKTKKIAISITAIVIAVVLVGSLAYNVIYNALYKNGVIQRNTVILESENYEVNAAMMSYFFYNSVNQYSSVLSQLGVDLQKPLKSQQCTIGEGSWFDYFVSNAAADAKNCIYLAEKAKDENITLNDHDKEHLESNIASIAAAAKSYNMSVSEYYSNAFGTGVKEGDVRDCLELQLLAQRYYETFVDTLKYTDDQIEQYYKDNIDTFRYVDFYSYAIIAEDTDDSATYAAAKEKADALAKVEDTKEFSKWVEDYYKAENPLNDEYTEAKQKEEVETVLSRLETKKFVKSTDKEALSKWLFETAKVGDTYVEDDKKGGYTVYLCTATPYREETLTRTIRNIVLTKDVHDEKEIESIAKKYFEEMKEKGLTEETFNEYAEKYSEHETHENGGLCENYRKESFVTAVGDWTFDEKRKAGDFELIKTDEGYSICYYVGEGLPGWKVDCTNSKQQDDYDAAYEKWTKEISVSENSKGYNKISDLG